jgi:hypothetical protein
MENTIALNGSLTGTDTKTHFAAADKVTTVCGAEAVPGTLDDSVAPGGWVGASATCLACIKIAMREGR